MKKLVLLSLIGVCVLAFACSCADSELRRKFPEYYALDAFKGIEVYVWEDGGAYKCGALTGTNRLKAILSSYDIGKENIVVLPFELKALFD